MLKNNHDLIFVIGPSGIGKSSLIKLLDFHDVQLFELDKIVAKASHKYNITDSGGAYETLKKIGNKSFFILGMNHLFENIATSKCNRFIVDVGAAFQNEDLFKYYSQIYNVILITANPKESHKRYLEHRSKDPRDFFTHCSIEFSPKRNEIYNSARRIIDTTNKTLEESKNELQEEVKRLWYE